MFHGGFSFIEAWNIPIKWRLWFMQRLNHEFDKKKDDGGQDIESLLKQSPARMKKF